MATTPVIRDITPGEFDGAVIEASKTRAVVVDFWATWCGPCRQLSPMLERMAARFAGEVDLVKVDVDQAPELARQYRVQGIPAVKAFRNGAVASEFVGVQPEQTVERFFAALAPSPADRLVSRAASLPEAERESSLREALQLEPGHVPATLALARLLATREDVAGAQQLLRTIPLGEEARRLQAELNVTASYTNEREFEDLQSQARNGDGEAAVRLGRALAARADHEEALRVLLGAVRHPESRDPARAAILEIFDLLGGDHALVRAARPQLAAALF